MRTERLRARAIAIAIAIAITGIVVTGCAGVSVDKQQVREQQEHHPQKTDVEMAIAHMTQAQQADDEQWLRLHQLLARTAAIKRTPHLRAYAALVLAQGQRSDEDLLRAEELMSRLLRQSSANSDQRQTPSALSPGMYQLMSMQYAQLLQRIATQRELAASKKKLARTRAKLATEIAAHAKTREQRHDLLVELDGTREKLRAVTRIELKHQSNGG